MARNCFAQSLSNQGGSTTITLKGLVDNIADQSKTQTVIENASLFDFNNPIDIKKPNGIYSVSYNHTVP